MPVLGLKDMALPRSPPTPPTAIIDRKLTFHPRSTSSISNVTVSADLVSDQEDVRGNQKADPSMLRVVICGCADSVYFKFLRYR